MLTACSSICQFFIFFNFYNLVRLKGKWQKGITFMVEVNRIGNYGYYPQATTFTGKKHEYRGTEDFKPGLYDPQAEEKAQKRKKNLLKAAGLLVLAGGAYLFLKKTNMGKKLWNSIKELFTKGGKKAAEDVKTTADDVISTTTKKPKVKTRGQVINDHVNLHPGEKVKMNGPRVDGAKGKENIHKVRRNKKQIIEETRLREQAEAFTTKDLDAYQKSLGTPATEAERQFIQTNNKAATNTIADVMESKGIKRTKAENGRVVLAQDAPVVKPKVTGTATPAADRITKIKDAVAEIDKKIAACTPDQQQTVRFLERDKARYTKQLEALTPRPAVVQPAVTPELKKIQTQQAWAQSGSSNKVAGPQTGQVPTANEIWAKAEAEAARMAKEEAEVLAKMGHSAA